MVSTVTKYLSKDGRDHATKEDAIKWETGTDLNDEICKIIAPESDFNQCDDMRSKVWSVSIRLARVDHSAAKKILEALRA